jgi:hypothetical protein
MQRLMVEFIPREVLGRSWGATVGAYEPIRHGKDTKAMLVLIKVFSSSPPFLCLGQHEDTDPGALFYVL